MKYSPIQTSETKNITLNLCANIKYVIVPFSAADTLSLGMFISVTAILLIFISSYPDVRTVQVSVPQQNMPPRLFAERKYWGQPRVNAPQYIAAFGNESLTAKHLERFRR